MDESAIGVSTTSFMTAVVDRPRGTQRITDTVHAAMREVVDREYRSRLANRRLFDDVTPEEFEAMRRGRNFDG